MEISKLDTEAIKIKGKNAAVVFNPSSKTDAEIVIATRPLDSLAIDKVNGVRLIISGPGEYEAGGISVSAKQVKEGVVYTIIENLKLVAASSPAVSSIPDDEEFDCVVIQVTEPFSDDTLGPLNKKCTVLYGDVVQAKINSENVEKVTKVNLKKTSEIQGKTFIFE